MCEVRRCWILVIALIVLVVAGCAPVTTTGPSVSSDSEARPATDGPTNFASPLDMLQRYPTMRRQQL